MASRRGEPRVCSMVPIPDETGEAARRTPREGEDLIGARRSIVNKIGGLLATPGVTNSGTRGRPPRAAGLVTATGGRPYPASRAGSH